MFAQFRFLGSEFGRIGLITDVTTAAGFEVLSDTINVGLSATTGVRLSGSSTETGITQVAVDSNLQSGSSNVLVAAAWTVADTQALIIVSSADATLKTNSSGSPANTIALKAGIPLIWRVSAGYFANPFTTDVTSWYITSTLATRIQALILTT